MVQTADVPTQPLLPTSTGYMKIQSALQQQNQSISASIPFSHGMVSSMRSTLLVLLDYITISRQRQMLVSSLGSWSFLPRLNVMWQSWVARTAFCWIFSLPWWTNVMVHQQKMTCVYVVAASLQHRSAAFAVLQRVEDSSWPNHRCRFRFK